MNGTTRQTGRWLSTYSKYYDLWEPVRPLLLEQEMPTCMLAVCWPREEFSRVDGRHLINVPTVTGTRGVASRGRAVAAATVNG
jgi:hypothetical protein